MNNERIKELAKQAGMHECKLGYGIPENVLWGEKAIEKFAELIVKECANTIKNDLKLAHIQLIPLTFNMYANGRLQRVIKEHFGI